MNMINKKEIVKEAFFMKSQCGVAVKIGNEWHTCNEEEGHKGLHGCKHYEWDNDQEMFDKPTDKGQKVRFIKA